MAWLPARGVDLSKRAVVLKLRILGHQLLLRLRCFFTHCPPLSPSSPLLFAGVDWLRVP
jgi:hypothetical protein